ncbi:MAG TPA: DUF2244 domain-containing protein [Stellaceae bacterium]|nr:DUF2244 domain-containing protein [Stellaceae bacterium]
MAEADASTEFYHAELRPHRSLPPKGFAIVMAIVAGGSFLIGIAFVLRGAWPVTPFFGLDVGLIYLAFRLSYRSARQREHLRLTVDALTLERVDVYGGRRRWRFQPFWLRVVLEEQDEDSNHLYLASHGKSVTVGAFLGPAERRKVAFSLKDALALWRRRVASPQAE